MIDADDYILPGLTRSLYLQLLRSASRSQGFSDAEARVSLLLDVDKGTVQSQRRYAEVWGWSHKQVRIRWDAVWQDVARLATSNGRQLDGGFAGKLPADWLTWARGTARAHEGHTKGTKKPPREPALPDSGHTKGTAGAHEGHASIHPTSYIQEKGVGDAGARGCRFEEWWAVYPKKRGKKPCLDKWKARGLDALADELIADVERRKAHDERWKRGFAPDPQTYLNQERWNDELSEPARAVEAGRRNGTRARDYDPAEAYPRILAAARGAAGGRPAGVDDSGRAGGG